MLIRLIRRPIRNGVPLSQWQVGHQWQVGQTYDLPPSLALALIVENYAHVEMRTGRDRRQRRRPLADERRKRRWWLWSANGSWTQLFPPATPGCRLPPISSLLSLATPQTRRRSYLAVDRASSCSRKRWRGSV